MIPDLLGRVNPCADRELIVDPIRIAEALKEICPAYTRWIGDTVAKNAFCAREMTADATVKRQSM